jgi:hypothetical protein
LRRQYVHFAKPRDGFYTATRYYFIQLSSGRQYSRFVYNGFLTKSFFDVMNCCKSDAFKTFVRLHSYSCHLDCYNLPIFTFFNYPSMYSARTLNAMEMKLFRVCRNADLEEQLVIVNGIQEFVNNLNNRFSFSFIKNWINFSLFVMAGK